VVVLVVINVPVELVVNDGASELPTSLGPGFNVDELAVDGGLVRSKGRLSR